MSLIVRAARAADRSRCLELIASLTRAEVEPGWADTFDALLDQTRGAIWVADDAGTVLGVATVSFNLAIRYRGEYCQLEELIVDPAARGKNAGGLLVAHAVAEARRRGCAEMGLYLIERTEGNRPFYEKYGFLSVGTEMRQAL